MSNGNGTTITLPEKAAVPFRWLQQHYEVDRLLQQQDEQPERIAEIQRQIVEFERGVREAKRALADQETFIRAEVGAELNEAGKAAWSSEDKRKAETARRFAADATARGLQATLQRCEDSLADARVDLDQATREWTAIGRKLDTISAVILAISGR